MSCTGPTATRPASAIRFPTSAAQCTTRTSLAAALLCRVYSHTGEEKFLAPALHVARYSAAKQERGWLLVLRRRPQASAGSTTFTPATTCARCRISRRYAETTEFDAVLRRGFEFYRNHFFREDGSVSYFHDRTYPIDIHCVAQSIHHARSRSTNWIPTTCRWRTPCCDGPWTHLWDDRGFFYYRV